MQAVQEISKGGCTVCAEYLVTIRGASESTVLKYSPDGAGLTKTDMSMMSSLGVLFQSRTARWIRQRHRTSEKT